MTAIEYDPAKHAATLTERGLDMARAGEVFDLPHLSFQDIRYDYGEDRWVTIGYLDDRMIVMAWTLRTGALRVISMRKANDREKARYGPRLD